MYCILVVEVEAAQRVAVISYLSFHTSGLCVCVLNFSLHGRDHLRGIDIGYL